MHALACDSTLVRVLMLSWCAFSCLHTRACARACQVVYCKYATDRDRDRLLTREDLEQGLNSLGICHTPAEFDSAWGEICLHDNKTSSENVLSVKIEKVAAPGLHVPACSAARVHCVLDLRTCATNRCMLQVFHALASYPAARRMLVMGIWAHADRGIVRKAPTDELEHTL